MTRADWSRVAGAYRQCVNALHPTVDYLPRPVPGFLAELMARLSSTYYGVEDEFIKDAAETFMAVRKEAGVPVAKQADLYQDLLLRQDPNYGMNERTQRRRPSPFEAAVETMRRLRDVREIEAHLKDHCSVAIRLSAVERGGLLIQG